MADLRTRARTLRQRTAWKASQAAGWTLERTLRSAPVRTRFPAARLAVTAALRSPDPAQAANDAMLGLRSVVPLTASDLIANYFIGLFPLGVYHTDADIRWEVVQDRVLITPETARMPRDMRRQARRSELDIQFDRDLDEIIMRCRRSAGTWLNDAVVATLHDLAAHGMLTCVGAYRDGTLVAGEFGLDIGGWYVGLSTFHDESGAGIVVRVAILDELIDGGRFYTIDGGSEKPHSMRLGAVKVSDAEFRHALLRHLGTLVRPPAPPADAGQLGADERSD